MDRNQNNMEQQNASESNIVSFFTGRTIFITGGSGFMGKVLVERLLATCPDIERLYLLMREKRGVKPETRLEQLKQCPVFDVLRSSRPQQLEKISIVSGDVTAPGLGIGEKDRSLLKNVSIVYHIAATVKMAEELKHAVGINLRSVISLLKLIDSLPNVEAFMHVSTAYCNAELPIIEERVYPPPMDVAELLQLVDTKDMSAEEESKIISSKPNSYTFTKSMAEFVIDQHGCQRYPIAILRPTIVVSSHRYPFPGWIENLNGPSGAIAGASSGMLHVITSDPNCRADIIPVDIAIDTLIACTWETVTFRTQEVRVYNCSTYENPVEWGIFKKIINEKMPLYPSTEAISYPYIVISKNRFISKTKEMVLQTIPLHLLQYISQMFRIKSFNFIKASEKLQAMNISLEYFGTREWEFRTDNIITLRNRMSQKDRQTYNVDVRSINWHDLITDFVKGTRKYVMKEYDSTLSQARLRVKRLSYFNAALKLFFLLIFCRHLTVRFMPSTSKNKTV